MYHEMQFSRRFEIKYLFFYSYMSTNVTLYETSVRVTRTARKREGFILFDRADDGQGRGARRGTRRRQNGGDQRKGRQCSTSVYPRC